MFRPLWFFHHRPDQWHQWPTQYGRKEQDFSWQRFSHERTTGPILVYTFFQNNSSLMLFNKCSLHRHIPVFDWFLYHWSWLLIMAKFHWWLINNCVWMGYVPRRFSEIIKQHDGFELPRLIDHEYESWVPNKGALKDPYRYCNNLKTCEQSETFGQKRYFWGGDYVLPECKGIEYC